jgi:amino acid permease
MVGAGVLSLPYAMSELGWYVVLQRNITHFFCYGIHGCPSLIVNLAGN